MKEVVVYSKPHCHYCSVAKQTLKRRNIPFIEVDVSVDPEGLKLLKDAGFKSVPQIYVDGIHVGDSQVAATLEV